MTDRTVPNAADSRPDDAALASLRGELAARVDGEIRFDDQARGAYSTDASNYREVPIGVVLPRSIDAGAEAVAVCREFGVPVLSRGGGTSLAGQCTNTAVVIDWTKHCNRLVSVDEEARTCVVEPGIVLDELNRQLADHGLMFGPKPSTHSHCAIGGMIGNNSCGATAQRYGTTADNVRALEILTYQGLRCRVGRTGGDELADILAEDGRRGELYRRLCDIRDRYADDIRDRFPGIPRRISGYNLDALVDGRGLDVARLVVGSESTLVTVLRAELELVPTVQATSMVVLGYGDITAAADAVPEIAAHSDPLELEAIDSVLVEFMQLKDMYPEAVAKLPRGPARLFAEFGADTAEDAERQSRDLLAALGTSPDDPGVLLTSDPELQEEISKVRESGLGATARVPRRPDAWPGWEDSAVAPEKLGDYLRDLIALYEEFDYPRPSFYGHFGHGCVHVRSPFDLTTARGVDDFTRFVHRAAELVASYGGSFSGEHGDGQARGALLPVMFGDRVTTAFAELKDAFDPDNRMNPGKVVHARGIAENLRLGSAYRPAHPDTFFAYPEDRGDFARAVGRCVGIGNCRQHEGGVMCPSYMVTGDEEHSTRGRARLLVEMLQGHDDSPVTKGWRSPEVHGALDLCLACKGCKSDCPVGVDMATYKAEFLAHHYRGRLRPAAHYSLGWLPVLAKAAAAAPRLANTALHLPKVADLGKRLAGVTPQRDAPEFAAETFQQWWRRRGTPEPDPGDPRAVVIWPDTFTNHFDPHIGQAAVQVLESAGFRVAVPTAPLCCGLTWISTGQLNVAEQTLRRTTEVLGPWLQAGTLIVGLEPSCAAVFRSDAHEMFPHDEDIQRLRSRFATFAEALVHHAPDRDWRPAARERRAIVQTHCHQYAVLGFDADRRLMREAGIEEEVLDSGCCGLAGNFGFERGHYDVSMAAGERVLLPAVRDAEPDTLVLADGFSCRTQVEQGGTGRRAHHLAEALAQPLPPEQPAARVPRPRRALARRPAAWLVVAAATTAITTAVVLRRRAG